MPREIFSSASRRAVSGRPRTSSAPARSRSKARNAVGWRRSSTSMSRSPLTWMRPCSRWKPAGRPLASSATISPSMSSGARSVRASGSSARTTAGNCDGLFIAEPRPEADVGPRLAGRDVDQRADAVVLRFEEQGRAGERRLRQRRQHRADFRRILCPAGHATMIRIVNFQAPTSKLQRTPNPQLPTPWGRAPFGSPGFLGRWKLGVRWIWSLELGSCRTAQFCAKCADPSSPDR